MSDKKETTSVTIPELWDLLDDVHKSMLSDKAVFDKILMFETKDGNSTGTLFKSIIVALTGIRFWENCLVNKNNAINELRVFLALVLLKYSKTSTYGLICSVLNPEVVSLVECLRTGTGEQVLTTLRNFGMNPEKMEE